MQTLHITIFRSEVVHDLDYDTLFLQKVRFLGKEGVLDEHVFSTDESNAYRVMRWFVKYADKVSTILGPYLKNIQTNTSIDVPEPLEQKDYFINMPDNWPYQLDNLTETIHDYILNGIEYQFLCLALGPNDSETQIKYQNLLDEEQEISVIVSARTTPLKVPFHPF